MARKIICSLLVVLLFAAPVYLRTLFEARELLVQADGAAARGEWLAAVQLLSRSASWDSPFNGAARTAADKLTATVFSQADPVLQEEGLWELRRALRRSRSWLRPREESDSEIARIEARLKELNLAHRAVREVHEPTVSYGAQAAAQIFFWGWIGAVLWAIAGGFEASGAIRRRVLGQRVVISLVLYAAWIVALRSA